MYTWDELQAAADHLATKEDCQFDKVLYEEDGKQLVVLHGFHGNLEMGLAYMVQEADAHLRPDEISRFGASLCYLDNLETGECTELEECIQGFKRNLEAEQKHRERKESEEQAARAEAERQRFHGFTDNMTPIQKGRVVKALDRLLRYQGNDLCGGGVMTRAVWIEAMQASGKANVQPTMYKGKKEYRIYFPVTTEKGRKADCFIEITKTEYEYFQYLKSR